jgi:hypothetical protein
MEKIKETLHMGSTAAKATGGTRQIPFSHIRPVPQHPFHNRIFHLLSRHHTPICVQ